MSLLLHLIFDEIIQPLIYGMGWAVVIVFTFGIVRPKKGAFYKHELVGLIGVYSWCAVPTALVLAWRALAAG